MSRESKGLSRRGFLKVSAIAALAGVVQACAQPTAAPAQPTTAPAQPTTAPAQPTTAPAQPTTPPKPKYNEAPALAELVKAGKLPPVEERLPQEPLVLPVLEEIGKYGGTWRRVAIGPSDSWIINSRLSYSAFIRYSVMANEIIPHVASKWEQNADGSEFTFYLRKGMRWSDGAPFTVDGMMFWYEDVLNNAELTPSISAWLKVSDKPVVIEKVDDYAFKFKFASSYGLFIGQLAAAPGQGIPDTTAKHYLSQFHIKYGDKAAIDAKKAELKLENWYNLYSNRAAWTNPERPHIWPWIITKAPPENPVIAERNPYYWCVDPQGNQLPYMDRIRLDNVEKVDVVNLKAISGEVDAQWRHLTWNNYPLFIENAQKGDYRVIKHTSASGSDLLLIPNLNYKDPVYAELMGKAEFRQALSLGINREELNEVIYQGMGVPRQASIVPSNKYYKPEHSAAYAEYNPQKANQMLDALGLDKKDAEGFRLLPNGQPLALVVEHAGLGVWTDALDMISQQFKAIGIRMTPTQQERALYSQRGAAKTERMIGVWGQDRCAHPLVEPLYWMPTWESQTTCGALYWDWYNTKGKEGVEPPEPVKKVYEYYDRCKWAKSDAELTANAIPIFDINAEQVWFIGTVGLLPAVAVVKNNLRNVPEDAVSDWLCLHPGNCGIETWFFKS